MSNEMINISFKLGEEPFIYSDVISMTKTVYESMTTSDIEKEKQIRYHAWLALVNPPEVIEESNNG